MENACHLSVFLYILKAVFHCTELTDSRLAFFDKGVALNAFISVNQIESLKMVKSEAFMDLKIVQIEKPEELNFILGQSHFIKTVEDVHETLVQTIPGIQFGFAFCEASGPRLVRWSGTNDELIELAKNNASAIGSGHCFILFLGNAFPINVLPALRNVSEICRVFCATANPTQVIVAETEQGRGILGVVDGESPLGIEAEEDIKKRKEFLRAIGYKTA
jgi:adenosine/AMP kinase